jgi:hypothetical protein
MHVLGDLLILDEQSAALPLPWWHRAALGLLHDTAVYVSLVEGTSRGVGELVVSVIDPNRRRIHLECRRDDMSGVLYSALQVIQANRTNINVALAEAVTIESGNLHQVSLVCELPDHSSSTLVATFKRRLKSAGFRGITVTEYRPLAITRWNRKGRISHGEVHGVEWRDNLLSYYGRQQVSRSVQEQFDLTKAVVTADLENRILRYVFPRRGAVSVEIRHADKPGALELLTASLGRCNLNILSALLRRGGNESGDATFIAVCEPLITQSVVETKALVDRELSQIDQSYRVDSKVSEGRSAVRTIYARHPDEIVARVPDALLPMVLSARRQFPKAKSPVFLSRRFLSSDNLRATRLVEHVRHVLDQENCFPVEALPAPGDHAPAPFQVASRLWASTGAVVLVVNSGQDTAFSMNLAHEYGFMQGQGKPILVLCERGQERSLAPLSNLHGLNVAMFASDATALADLTQEGSIAYELHRWISTFAPSAD